MVCHPAILVTCKRPFLGLRSDNQLELVMPRTHLITCRDRAFSAAANLWNSIPVVATKLCNIVTTFTIYIKTYLFNLVYQINQWFYQTQNIMCWQVLLIKCDGCGYVFLSKFYPMCFIHCSALLSTAEKVLYQFDFTLHYMPTFCPVTLKYMCDTCVMCVWCFVCITHVIHTSVIHVIHNK